jgi:hypothetical protein
MKRSVPGNAYLLGGVLDGQVHRLTTDNGQQTADIRQQTVGSGQQAAGSRQWAPDKGRQKEKSRY